MTPRLGHPPHSEALVRFMHCQGSFVPERVEPTILQGSPPPRRRRSRPSSAQRPIEYEFEDKQTDPMSSPRISPGKLLPDALLSRAFGASPLLFQHADTTPVKPGDEASDIELLKKLSISELLDVFRGNDPAPPHPSPPHPSPSLRYNPSPWDAPIWPPLPLGPPPPTALPSPTRELSAWSPTASAALAVAHRRPSGVVSWSYC